MQRIYRRSWLSAFWFQSLLAFLGFISIINQVSRFDFNAPAREIQKEYVQVTEKSQRKCGKRMRDNCYSVKLIFPNGETKKLELDNSKYRRVFDKVCYQVRFFKPDIFLDIMQVDDSFCGKLNVDGVDSNVFQDKIVFRDESEVHFSGFIGFLFFALIVLLFGLNVYWATTKGLYVHEGIIQKKEIWTGKGRIILHYYVRLSGVNQSVQISKRAYDALVEGQKCRITYYVGGVTFSVYCMALDVIHIRNEEVKQNSHAIFKK